MAALARGGHPGGAAVTTVVDTPERQALRATVRAFVSREVLPYQDEWERAGELPRALHPGPRGRA